MGSFSSELGVRFDTCMEAPHVINTESQLWAAVVSSGVGNIQLNASYKTADNYTFQDSLGETLEEICRVVPGGALVFFPSYKLLEKLHARWHQTGQWSRLNAQKELFIEPRGSSIEFEPVLRGYYDAILGKNKRISGKIRNRPKKILKSSSCKGSPQISNRGAAFLAVCRGKVSEGIDFSDDNARVVVIVGIPFPNKNDTQVMLKKRFNDTYKSSKNLLSGSEWYCHQAFRALNQAAGRCIRHRFDYGAIILLDERYKEQRNIAYISKWLRSSIKSYKSFDESLEGLQTFFRNTKSQHILEEVPNDLVDYKNNKDIVQPFKSPHQVTSLRGNQKLKEPKIIQYINMSTGLVKENSPVFQPKTPLIKTNDGEDKKALRRDTNDDSESKSLRHFSVHPFSPGSSPDLPMILDDNIKSATPVALVFQNFHQVSELPSTLSCVTTSGEFTSHDVGLVVAVTPEKLTFSVPSDIKCDPHFSMSVNSYNQKKRRSKELQNTSCPEMDCSNTCVSNSTACFDFLCRTTSTKHIDRRTETSFEDNKRVGLELFKPEKQYIPLPSSDPCEQLELHVCCLSCKNSLGLPENSFLVKSSMMLSSKVYLSYIRRYGTSSSLRPDCLLKTSRTKIRVLTSDISLVNERIYKERTKTNLSDVGIWCEEDGCVFRTVFCPFCTDSETCFGVQVLATDASNANLLNKVLFYADCLCVNDESKSFNEGVLRESGNLLCEGSDQVEDGKYAHNILLEEAAYDKKQKPVPIMINNDNSHTPTIENDRFTCKVALDKPAYSPKKKLNSVKENAGFHQPWPIDIEQFAYKPQNKPSFDEKLPPQILPEQIEKPSHCPHPKASNLTTTARTKLKLPRRR